MKKEIYWSTISSIIFAFAGILTLWLWQSGKTKIYYNIAAFGAWYLPCSLLLSMLLQETYYYWLHRLMHHPALFSKVHKIHHDSHTTSPFTAFSFHPIESVIQAIALPAVLLLLPLHPIVIPTQLVLMSFTSVINHLNIDIYREIAAKNYIGKWVIGATHHSHHHKQHRYNFGLYFTIWDKLIKTECPVKQPLAGDNPVKK
ncbi:MAG: sterol desaturase family protein [Chitinophagaceae bacterium]